MISGNETPAAASVDVVCDRGPKRSVFTHICC